MPTPLTGGPASVVSMTTPSPLPALSANTPNTSLALASLQALPESQLVLVVLDHPLIRQKWATVAVPLIDAICKKFLTIYPGSRLLIGTVVYRATTDDSLLRPSWTLARTKFETGSKVLDLLKDPSRWLGRPIDGTIGWLSADDANIFGKDTVQSTSSAFALEAFVAALELLEAPEAGVPNILAPKATPVLARHLLHVCLDSASIHVDSTTPPCFNTNSNHDQLSSSSVGTKLARLTTSISTCALKDSTSPSPQSLSTILGLHKSVSEPGKLQNEDLAVLLSEHVRTKLFSDANIMVSGLTAPYSGTGGTKRGRSDSNEPTTPLKRTKSGSISMHLNRTPPSNSGSVPPADLPMPKSIKLDPSVSTKIMFLRQQQEIMFKNWTVAYSSVIKSEGDSASTSSKAPGMNKTYLEQIKNQLWAQQQALKMLVHRVISGAEASPNFNICLQSLINIDKEARDMGVTLGGPGGSQPNLNRPSSSGGMGQSQPAMSLPPVQQIQPAKPPLQQQPAVSAPAIPAQTSSNAGPAQNASAPLSPAKPKPFWKGAITWSVISDPATKQKRDIATLVSATSNSSSLEKLMSPWPDKLQITAITQLAPRNLQIYAQTQGAPYILFGIQGVQDSSVPITQATAERNAQMYASLAGSLDAKKSCAFIRHGSNPGAGIVLFATTQPTSSAERNAKPGSVPPKLIGVVLKDPIPFTKLLAAQTASESGTAANTSFQPAKAPTPQSAVPANSAQQPQSSYLDSRQTSVPLPQQQQPIPNYSMPLPQTQPHATAPTSMGLGSSMPFNLQTLAAMSNANQANAPNYGNLGSLGSMISMSGGGPPPPGANSSSLPPNLSSLAQMLGINNSMNNGQSMFMQHQLQQQQQQQQPPPPPTNLFDNPNPFGGTQQNTMDTSKPMTMEQLRALGFIQ